MKKIIFLIVLMIQISYASKDKPTLNFAYYLPSMKNIDVKDIKISLKFWAKELSSNTGVVMNSYFYTEIIKLKKDFDNQKIDVLSASPLVFIKNFDLLDFQDGFKSVSIDAKSQNRLLFVVRKDANINDLKDLRGKRVSRLNSDIEELYLNSILQKSFGKDADQFFKQNLFVKKYSKAILKLFFKKVDLCIVTESAFNLVSEMNPQIKKRLKIIRTEDVNLASSSFFRKGVDKNTLQMFKNQAFTIHHTKRGKQILMVFKADHVAISKIEELDSVKKIYRDYLALKK